MANNIVPVQFEVVRKKYADHLHEQRRAQVVIALGKVYQESQFAPGDVDMPGNESWTGELFERFTQFDEEEVTIRNLGYITGRGYDYRIDGSSYVADDTPVGAKTIYFGGDSSGEHGYCNESTEVLLTAGEFIDLAQPIREAKIITPEGIERS